MKLCTPTHNLPFRFMFSFDIQLAHAKTVSFHHLQKSKFSPGTAVDLVYLLQRTACALCSVQLSLQKCDQWQAFNLRPSIKFLFNFFAFERRSVFFFGLKYKKWMQWCNNFLHDNSWYLSALFSLLVAKSFRFPTPWLLIAGLQRLKRKENIYFRSVRSTLVRNFFQGGVLFKILCQLSSSVKLQSWPFVSNIRCYKLHSRKSCTKFAFKLNITFWNTRFPQSGSYDQQNIKQKVTACGRRYTP